MTGIQADTEKQAAQSEAFIREGSGDATIVVFAGLFQGMGLPLFEFRKSLADLPFSKIYLRDSRRSWYHSGIEGLGNDIPSSVTALQSLLEGSRRTVFVGNSMGGFAALLFGSLLKADHIVAFSPQTSIELPFLIRNRDFRWIRPISKVVATNIWHNHVFDLRPIVTSSFDLYCGNNEELDVLHANHIEGKGGNIHKVDGKGHGLVKYFRDKKELIPIITRLI